MAGKRAEKRPVRLTNKFVATLTGTEMWWDDGIHFKPIASSKADRTSAGCP